MLKIKAQINVILVLDFICKHLISKSKSLVTYLKNNIYKTKSHLLIHFCLLSNLKLEFDLVILDQFGTNKSIVQSKEILNKFLFLLFYILRNIYFRCRQSIRKE